MHLASQNLHLASQISQSVGHVCSRFLFCGPLVLWAQYVANKYFDTVELKGPRAPIISTKKKNCLQHIGATGGPFCPRLRSFFWQSFWLGASKFHGRLFRATPVVDWWCPNLNILCILKRSITNHSSTYVVSWWPRENKNATKKSKMQGCAARQRLPCIMFSDPHCPWGTN